VSKPAVLGGEPAFESLLPIIRPTIVPFEELEEDLREIITSGIVTVGPVTRRLEQLIAEYVGVPSAVGVANCTSGLMLAIQALGLKPGGEVIVPSFTFAATVHGVVWNGLVPVFVDSLPGTCGVDPAAVESAITPRTGAVVATDVFGLPCEVEVLVSIARGHGLGLIFDSAQSLGATYEGRPVGGFGDAQVFSMSPTKVVTAIEGGVIVTPQEEMAERLRRGRDYGKARDGMDMEFVGLSARMSEVHALVGERNFRRLGHLVESRHERIAGYQDQLGDIPGLSFQQVPADRTTSGNYMVVFVDEDGFGLSRDLVYQALAAENIQTKKYFYPAVHRQTAFAQWHAGKEPLPVADRLSREAIALPLWSHLDSRAITRVAEAIRSLQDNAAEIRSIPAHASPA